MKIMVRFLVAAVVVAAGLTVPTGPAAAASGGHHPRFSALVFSKTAALRHESIPAGVAAIQQLGAWHR